MRASLRVVVIRAQPWYRRSLRILYEDSALPLREYVRMLQERLAARRHAKAPQPTDSVNDSRAYYFEDPAWRDHPAVEIVGQYLNMMEQEVAAAEKDFAN
jgi:hypothetical protein